MGARSCSQFISYPCGTSVPQESFCGSSTSNNCPMWCPSLSWGHVDSSVSASVVCKGWEVWLVPLWATLWEGSRRRAARDLSRDTGSFLYWRNMHYLRHFPSVQCCSESFVELIATLWPAFNPSVSLAVSGKKSYSGGLNYVVFCIAFFFFLKKKRKENVVFEWPTDIMWAKFLFWMVPRALCIIYGPKAQATCSWDLLIFACKRKLIYHDGQCMAHKSNYTNNCKFLCSSICPWIIFRKQSPLKTLRNFGCLSEMVELSQ